MAGFHSIARNSIQQMVMESQPLMPQNYGTTLTQKELDNLITFLAISARSGSLASKPGKED